MIARTSATPVKPTLAALPVVCNTNQGTAINVSELPVTEIVFAQKSVYSGRRLTDDALRSFACMLILPSEEPLLLRILLLPILLRLLLCKRACAALALLLCEMAGILHGTLRRAFQLGDGLLDPGKFGL